MAVVQAAEDAKEEVLQLGEPDLGGGHELLDLFDAGKLGFAHLRITTVEAQASP